MLPNDNVSMSVGHLDHVFIVYSSMEHVTWKSPGPMWDKAKVVDREAQRQTRRIKEALWIRKTPMCINRDAGYYQLSHHNIGTDRRTDGRTNERADQ